MNAVDNWDIQCGIRKNDSLTETHNANAGASLKHSFATFSYLHCPRALVNKTKSNHIAAPGVNNIDWINAPWRQALSIIELWN